MATSRRVRKRDRKLLGLENGSGLPTWIKIRCATSLPEATAARNARAFSVGFAVSPVGNVPAPTMNRLSCANNCDIALLPILRHRKRISNDRNVRPGKPGGCACATRQINASKYASSLTNLASAPFSAASLPAYQDARAVAQQRTLPAAAAPWPLAAPHLDRASQLRRRRQATRRRVQISKGFDVMTAE